MKKVILSIFFLIIILQSVLPGGAKEASASAVRGKYLAGRGIITPASEVHVNSYIAQIDYNYPNPETPVGITFISGNKRISNLPHREIVHIGFKGKSIPFEELPPLNLAFVIDKSGSMEQEDKIDWVKKSFEIFINRVRDIDYISLIVFDNDAAVLYPSTKMDSISKRKNFQSFVNNIQPGGGTNLSRGLELGYIQVLSNFRKEYTNRVLFLTDGVGESEGIIEMAKGYKARGINVSTIGVGQDFDLELMLAISKAGGGSTRFISDREEMAETFGSELDRMVVSAAKNLQMKLEFPEWITPVNTWGYNNRIDGNTIYYSQATLHNGDYETILAEIEVTPPDKAEELELARFYLSYTDLEDKPVTVSPLILNIEITSQEHPTVGYSNSTVMQSAAMRSFAQTLIDVGNIYYSIPADYDRLNEMKSDLWDEEYGETAPEMEQSELLLNDLTDSDIQNLEREIKKKFKKALNLVKLQKQAMTNIRLRLDNMGFEDELFILDKYMDILGKELKMPETDIVVEKQDIVLPAPVEGRDVIDHINNLFDEVMLNLEQYSGRVIAVSGFTAGEKDDKNDLIRLLDESALTALKGKNLQIVERSKLNKVIEEQKLQLIGLTDTDTAIEVGHLLSADYILTGSIIDMGQSVIIFTRIINIKTAMIESVAQVILPKSDILRTIL